MHGICHACMSVSWFREQTMFMCLYTYMGVSELARMCLGRKVGRIEREKFVRAWSMEFGSYGHGPWSLAKLVANTCKLVNCLLLK
jgi:hypothetical protein